MKRSPLTDRQVDLVMGEIAMTAGHINWLAEHLCQLPRDDEGAAMLGGTIAMLAQRVGWMADLRALRSDGERMPYGGSAEDWMIPVLNAPAIKPPRST